MQARSTEMVQELGLALGVAVLGSLAAVAAGAGIVLLAVLAAVVLRHIGRLGSSGYAATGDGGRRPQPD
ncbi:MULTISPECIES: hypothetical protein [unclassified Crossiella]|uniref:hypothetical protein n=1 Tax=unclassified Crossiella TaxID=2620835 RepID=UPI001FFE7D58|nr:MULTISPECIES: hypothetical protein [unclassified Crossiella]MCK2244506.1 hypothetical protein [Crossiella sp. S99.2]MCK2258137.1 hypothetical protein [Crossiella sp. S99.1]